ncbi:hypothetical protein GOP47_0025650 [Adiantum capillus-veneris]|uniref:PTM/DIR17-like Tudor domain-containing protein n=1 Tax=Adiantum capillus-veneris TaxID=13818 RepID=A0A9D4U0I7_ADICA|nr:hypothetical protein GOP47_0025650 [Adiantum capillus-veneris]
MVAPVLEAMTEGGGSKVDLSALEDVGLRLSHPSSSKDVLCNALEQASALLSLIQQLPQKNVLTAMKPSMDALIKPALLKHKDKDVQFLVTACISEIMRIVAPDAPYDDETLKEIFELIVASFKGLNEKESRFFDKRMKILDSVASVRSCVVMLDLECDDLIREMFQTFFTVVSEEPKSVILAMRAIMCLVLEESEEIPLPLLDVLLRNLLPGKKGVSNTGYALARAVFERCDAHLRPQIETVLTSKAFKNKWRESYHDLIFELSRANATYILPLVPKLIEELQNDKVEVRLKTMRLVGRILVSEKENTPESFNEFFIKLLSLIFDSVPEIRLAAIEFAKHYLHAKPSGPKAQELLDSCMSLLADNDAGVRRQVVATICAFVKSKLDTAKSKLDTILIDPLKKISDCLLDSEAVVRQETFQQLIGVHKAFCLKFSEGSVAELESFCWIPSKLISCFADQDSNFFRSQAIEVVFAEQLFPVEFPIEQKVDCWIVSFATLDNKGLKVFEKIFDDKKRLQQEMRNYLANQSISKEKETEKSKTTDLQKTCKRLASFFADPVKAELEFQSLSDSKLLKMIVDLLDANMSSLKCSCLREDLLKLYAENGIKNDFLRELAIKCSFALFDKEHMRVLLLKVKDYRSSEDERMLKASVNLMLVIAKYFPSLLEGAEADLLELLKDERDFIKDGVVQILAEIGGNVRMELCEEYNSVNLLEKYCVEGNRKHVKYAVQALSALCGDSRSDALTTLYGKLLDALKSGTNLPTTLKSLGIIAQCTKASHKTQQEELVNFLTQDLLRRDSDLSADGDEQLSAITHLKILGLKMLVRTFLPIKELEHVELPKELFEALLGLLISDNVISSNIDKAHLRLAAANAVLKLSRVYDDEISPKLFQAAISCVKDPNILVKHGFVKNVHKGLMEQAIPSKYACAFVLNVEDGEAGALEEAKQQLGDYVKHARQVLSKKFLSEKDSQTSSVTFQPAYVLFYLVHTLAQEIQSPALTDGGLSLEAIEPVFRKLYLFIWALLLGDEEIASIDTSKEDDLETIAFICSVFSAMKYAVDSVDASKSEATYLLCDIGISLIKDIVGDAFTNLKLVHDIPLPVSIYKSVEGNTMADRSYLPSVLEEGEALSKLKSGWPLSVVVKQGKRKADSGSLKDVKTPLHKRSKVMDASNDERKERNKRTGIEKVRSAESEPDVQGADATPVSPKRKRGAHHGNENGEVSSPETRHERVDETKSTRKPKNLKISVNETEDVKHGGIPSPEVLSPDGSATKRVRIFIKKPRPPPEPPLVMESINKEDSVDTKKRSRKDVLDAIPDDGAAETSAQPLSSPRGTPRRSSKLAASSGLESPKAKVVEDEEPAAHELVGCRIRVWWPMDKKFYNGTVKAYQPSKRTHKVVYEDGDVEFLKLGNERWDILKDTKETPGSPSTKSKSHADDGFRQSKEKQESRNTKEGSDRKKSGSQSKSKKSSSKQGETEVDDPSNRSDNTETTEHGQEMADAEETLGSVAKRRKSVEKTGKKSNSKSADLKVDDNAHGESPSTVSKESRESGDLPLKAWKSGRRKGH